MEYSLYPATVEDAPALAEIYHEAFKGDHILGYFYLDTPRNILREKDINYLTNEIQHGPLYGGRVTKVVEDSTNTAVAFVAWHYPHRLTAEQKATKERIEEEAKKVPHLPGAQGALIDEFFHEIEIGRKKWIDHEKTHLVHLLAVLPEHQGKGLSGRLLRPGLEEADKAGAQTYIEASPAGLPVYLKYGWKIIDGMDIDMRPYGGNAVEHQPFLMREAGAPKTS